MRPWLAPTPLSIPDDYRAAIGGHPLVAEVLYRRGFQQVGAALAFLEPRRYTPAPAEQLPDLARAAERIEQAIRQSEPILVWGDVDVDGQPCSPSEQRSASTSRCAPSNRTGSTSPTWLRSSTRAPACC
jgi:hypothetical protein